MKLLLEQTLNSENEIERFFNDLHMVADNEGVPDCQSQILLKIKDGFIQAYNDEGFTPDVAEIIIEVMAKLNEAHYKEVCKIQKEYQSKEGK